MKNNSIRLMIAFLTFTIGVAVSSLWLFLRSPHPNTSDSSIPSLKSNQYENPAIYSVLFTVVRDSAICPYEYDERALVLSYADKPVEPQADDPDAPTIPGFYLSSKVRIDFERVEVIGNKVYFKTNSIGGISYEFSGISGEEVIPNSSPSTRVSFIKGKLTRLRNGEIMEQEEIKFRYVMAG